MVSSATQSQSQSQPPTAEEEALRRNTDCVYFLASPLTCKKGRECEYRHSDIARVNPTDCWYWLNGNCLNAKCAFRHPPLDGLLGAQTPASSGPSAHIPSNTRAPAPAPVAHTLNAFPKQGVACIFFQKGFCVKGDWCPFLHGPNSLGGKASPLTATTSAAKPAGTAKKVFSGIETSLQEKKALPINAVQSVKDSQVAKLITNVEHSPRRNGYAVNKKLPQTSGNHEFTACQPVFPVSNGSPVNWPHHVQQSHLLEEPDTVYGKDIEVASREPSPGFDVLVDDQGRDSDYYAGEDTYTMSMEHDDRNEYDLDHSTDYNIIAVADRERYGSSLGYDSHDLCIGDQYAWEQHRASSERIPGGAYPERRSYDRPNSRGRDESDLRHRLAKYRRPHSLRSVINCEQHHDMQVGHRSYHGVHRDDKSLSGRLRGRIRIPRRSVSPIRAGILSPQGRIQDRIKGRLEEPFNNGSRNHGDMHSRQDTLGGNNANFAGPKSLAELKHKKNAEPVKQQAMDLQSLGKRNRLALDGNQQSGGKLSFEGPKPLEEILKRKRGKAIGNPVAGNSSNNQGATENENCEQKDSSMSEVQNSSPAQKTYEKETRQGSSNSPEQPVSRKLEDGDVMHAENQMDEETESCEHKEGEHEYDQTGGEDYELFDGENGDGSGEYAEDGENGDGSGEYAEEEEDDDDEFAKKMGVVYT